MAQLALLVPVVLPQARSWPAAALLLAGLVVATLTGAASRAGTGPGGRAHRGRVATGRARGAGRQRGHPSDDRSARWARRADLAPLVTKGEAPGRLVLGATIGLWGRPSRVCLAVAPAQSVAVVGPTQSGKTSALAVPAILAWDGPVVAASVKTDLVRDTLAWRTGRGQVWCFDPTGATGLPASPWSPLPAAATWPGARRVAADLVEVARGASTTADGEFWYATAAKLLAPLLFAASTGGRQMADVLRWVDTQELAEVAELLERAGVPEALQAARASWLRDERQRSSVYTTAETVLEPFGDPVPPDGHPIDPHALLDGEHTLYLCAPAHDQRRLAGLFTALVKQVVETAFARSARSGSPLRPPLLVVLDEAANIAPLAELDTLAATCASHGVQLVTVWQDLAQVTARYGARAATVVNNHRARLFLPGIADPGTLDHASHLVGEEAVLTPTVTRDGTGGRSTTGTVERRRLLPPAALRQLTPGTALLVYGTLPPALVALRPWWQVPELAARAAAKAREAAPARPAATDGAPGRRRAGTVRRSGVRRIR